MRLPPRAEAERLLEAGHAKNPGPWLERSRNVALAARLIAERHPRLGAEAAFVMGLLHDIGRQEGVSGLRHAIDGYTFLARLGYERAARICLTHSFQLKAVGAVSGALDCTPEELDFIERFLRALEYDDDRLIQLCDALRPSSAPCPTASCRGWPRRASSWPEAGRAP